MPSPWPDSPRHLSRDRKLAPLVRKHGPPSFALERNRFRALAEAILYQQLAGAAAATIVRRVRGIYPDGRFPSAKRLDETPDARLRSAGVSPQKLGYLRDLSRKTLSGDLRLRGLSRLDDDAVVEELTKVQGIGRWTAEMFLIFSLGRPDVLSTGDYGVQKGMRHVYGLRKLPSPDRMGQISKPWRPYRSAGCWYMWRAVETVGPPKDGA